MVKQLVELIKALAGLTNGLRALIGAV